MGNKPIESKLKASVGKVRITPRELAPLQGYDPETNIADPTTDLLDDLYARILILDNGVKRVLFVSVDCCMPNEVNVPVPDPMGRPDHYREFIATLPKGTRKRWAEAAGTDEFCITVSATHTHTAPAQYSKEAVDDVERAIQKCAADLVPAKISVGKGQSYISAFRRPHLRADLNVPIDQTLFVLYIETIEKGVIGAVVNYAVHPTALRNPTSRLSGDIVGLAMKEVEQSFGGEFVSLFTQGFSGDVCPLFGDNGPTEDTYTDVKRGGAIFSADIINTYKDRNPVEVSELISEVSSLELPTRPDFYKKGMPLTMVGVQIGELFILFLSGELFNDYTEKIRSISPFRYTFLSGVSNGYSGYIPTIKAFRDGMGGYEIKTTPYTEEVEDILLNGVERFMTSSFRLPSVDRLNPTLTYDKQELM